MGLFRSGGGVSPAIHPGSPAINLGDSASASVRLSGSTQIHPGRSVSSTIYSSGSSQVGPGSSRVSALHHGSKVSSSRPAVPLSCNLGVGTSGTGNSTQAELSNLLPLEIQLQTLQERKSSFLGKGSGRRRLPTRAHTWVCLASL